MEKTFSQELADLKKHRKLLYKSFTEIETGDKYQLIMFSLEYGSGSLLAIMALSSHTAYKRAVPMRAFKGLFELFDPHEERKKQDATAST